MKPDYKFEVTQNHLQLHVTWKLLKISVTA